MRREKYQLKIIKWSCLKRGSEMNHFCLNKGSGFEGFAGTPVPKTSLEYPLPT